MLWVPFRSVVDSQAEQVIRLESGEEKTIAELLAERPELENALMAVKGEHLICAFRPPESPNEPEIEVIGEIFSGPDKKHES
jgi:hypothetical protein